MEKRKIIFMALAFTIMPIGTHAQENLKKAIKDFIEDKNVSEYITADMFSENKTGTQSSLSYCHTYRFDMPANMLKKIDPLRNAFYKDTECAYNVMIKSAGSKSNEKMNIAYGDRLDKKVQFGAYVSHNYMVMLVHDKQDSLKRYCYAVTWYMDSNKDRLCGSLFKIYGKDPARRRNTYPVYTIDSYGNMEQTDTENREKHTLIKTDQDSIRSDIDFLQMFGNLNVAYKKNIPFVFSNETLLIGLANKILEICRKYNSLLSKNEKEICTGSLKELKKMTDNKYLSGLLTEAIVSLNN